MKKILLFSHGFGVKRDDRGLFTDIASQFPDYQSVMFDYNEIDEMSNTLTATPIEQQAKILTQQYNNIPAGQEVFLICHSQGCMVAALTNLQNIKKVVFITPAQTVNVDAFLKKFEGRANTHIDRQGDSTFARKDGSTTIVPKAYLDSIEGIELSKLYAEYCKNNDVLIISAKQDEVLRDTNFDYLSNNAQVASLPGDHNFSDQTDRQRMIVELTSFIN